MSQEMADEFSDFNDSIEVYTRKYETLIEANELVEQGEQQRANKLLTDEANIMDDLKFDVDQKTEEYNELSYKS